MQRNSNAECWERGITTAQDVDQLPQSWYHPDRPQCLHAVHPPEKFMRMKMVNSTMNLKRMDGTRSSLIAPRSYAQTPFWSPAMVRSSSITVRRSAISS